MTKRICGFDSRLLLGPVIPRTFKNRSGLFLHGTHDEGGTTKHNWSARCQYIVTGWVSMWAYDLASELFSDCTRSCFLQVVLCPRGGDRIYEMRCLFVAVGLNARFVMLPHWDNMS